MPSARRFFGCFLYNIPPAKSRRLFKCVSQSGNVEYREEGGLHTHRYMNQRPVSIWGREYAHLNQDKLVYFIYQVFIIEYILPVNNSASIASLFLRHKFGLCAQYLEGTFSHSFFHKISTLFFHPEGFVLHNSIIIPSRLERTFYLLQRN